jgi:hypothetical protein
MQHAHTHSHTHTHTFTQALPSAQPLLVLPWPIHTHTHNYVHNDKHTYRLELWHGEDTLELLESVAGILPEHMLI